MGKKSRPDTPYFRLLFRLKKRSKNLMIIWTARFDKCTFMVSSSGGEMVYTGDLKSPGRKALWVRVPPRAPDRSFSSLEESFGLEVPPPMKKWRVLKGGKIIESVVPGKYAGWKKGKIFGRLDCWSGKRIKRENRVFFLSWQDATEAGYRPCKHCNPAP